MEIIERSNSYLELVKAFVITYGLALIGALLVLIAGLYAIKFFVGWMGRFLDRKHIDASLRPFLVSLVDATLKIVLVLTVLGMVGVEMTSFIAILGAAGLAIGLALSGTLQNFAGGVLILIIKPFKVGDTIISQGHTGTVKEIQIFNTILKTGDNITIILPNGPLANSSIVNYSSEEKRRVDWVFSIAYGDDFSKAKALIRSLVDQDARIHQDPEPFIVLSEMAASSIDITVRVWTKSADYWAVKFDLNQQIYQKFGEAGLSIPYPQMDIHVRKLNS